MLIAILMALVLGPSPSPTPSYAPERLPVIVTVKSTVFCTAVRTMAVPLGVIAQRDDAAFAYLDELVLVKVGAPVPEKDWSWLTEAIAQREISYNVAQNLVLADNVMNASWKSYPRGTDVNIDVLRQRLQNMIDLQRAVDNAYLVIGFGTENCLGSEPDDYGNVRVCRPRKGLVSGELRRGDAAALNNQHLTADPEDLPVANAHDIAHFGSVTAIKYQLDLQEFAFEKELQTAAATCGI